jgi:hypothetical protein
MKKLEMTLNFTIDDEYFVNDIKIIKQLAEFMIDNSWDEIYDCGLTPLKKYHIEIIGDEEDAS